MYMQAKVWSSNGLTSTVGKICHLPRYEWATRSIPSLPNNIFTMQLYVPFIRKQNLVLVMAMEKNFYLYPLCTSIIFRNNPPLFPSNTLDLPMQLLPLSQNQCISRFVLSHPLSLAKFRFMEKSIIRIITKYVSYSTYLML